MNSRSSYLSGCWGYVHLVPSIGHFHGPFPFFFLLKILLSYITVRLQLPFPPLPSVSSPHLSSPPDPSPLCLPERRPSLPEISTKQEPRSYYIRQARTIIPRLGKATQEEGKGPTAGKRVKDSTTPQLFPTSKIPTRTPNHSAITYIHRT